MSILTNQICSPRKYLKSQKFCLTEIHKPDKEFFWNKSIDV